MKKIIQLLRLLAYFSIGKRKSFEFFGYFVSNFLEIKDHKKYEKIIKSYDKKLTFKTISGADIRGFDGSGLGIGSLNYFRIIKMDNGKKLFEKIFFKKSITYKKFIYYKVNLYPSLLDAGLKMPEIEAIEKGNKLIAVYYGFVESNIDKLNDKDFYKCAIEAISAMMKIPLDNVPKKRLFFDFRHERMYKSKLYTLKRHLILNLDFQNLKTIREFENRVYKFQRFLQHGDLSKNNIICACTIIDWDNFGFYPVGYDIGNLLARTIHDVPELSSLKTLSLQIYEELKLSININQYMISTMYFYLVFTYRKFSNDEQDFERYLELIRTYSVEFGKMEN